MPILALLNTFLPSILKLYKEVRAANPGQPALTDAQMIELLFTDAEAVKAKADAWLAAHPGA